MRAELRRTHRQLAGPVAVGAAAGLVAGWLEFRGVGGLALGLVVVLGVLALPARLPVGVRLALAFVLFGAATTAWVLVVPLLGLGLAPGLWVAVGAGGSAAVWHRRRGQGRGRPPGIEELVSAVLLVTVAGFAAWQVLGPHPSGQLGRLVGGEDHASHLSLVEGIRAGGRYVYRASGAQARLVFTGLQNYPQGSHALVAMVERVLGRGSGPRPVVQAVGDYVIAVWTMVALLAFCAGEAAAALARRLGARGLVTLAAAFVPFLALVLGPVGSLATTGFFSQVTAYIFLSGLVLCAAEPTADRLVGWRVAVAAAVVVAVAACWYFLLPVALIGALALAWPLRHLLRSAPWRSAGVLLGTATLSLPHLAVSLAAGAGSSINAAGGVIPLDRGYVLLTLAVSGVAIAVAGHTGRLRPLGAWAAAWVAAAGFSLAVALFQRATVGRTSYYYEKSLYTVGLLGLLGLAAVLALLLRGVAASPRARQVAASAACAGALVAGLTVTGGVSPRTQSLVETARHGLVSDPLFATIVGQLPDQTPDPVLVWHLRNPFDDYLTNRLLGAAYHQDSPERWASVYQGLTRQRPGLLVPLLVRHQRVTVFTSAPDLAADLFRRGVPRRLLDHLRVIRVRAYPRLVRPGA